MTSGSIAEASVAPRSGALAEVRSRAASVWYWAEQVILGLAAILYALHFLHLRADFPNHSPWMDWAKYTDEGWYGGAAIRHYQWGHWNVPGDFNPAAALPVQPLLEGLLFRFTGVSLVAVRVMTVCVFGLILLASYFLLRRWAAARATHNSKRSLAPAIAVLLLASNPFCFAFTRMGILEPLMVLLTLSAILLAQRAREGESDLQSGATLGRFRSVASSVLLGVLLLLIVLTKTTGLFLFPAVLYVLWGATGWRGRVFLRAAAISLGTTAVLWLSYYGLFVHRHYLADYQYLFSANTYTRITLATFWSVLQETLLDGTLIGDTLFWSSLIAAGVWIVFAARKRFRVHPLPIALVLWVFGYAAFLAYHANFAPRYYLVIAVPLVLLLAMAFDALIELAIPRMRRNGGIGMWTWFVRVTALGSTATLLFILIHGAQQTIHYATNPEYTFVTAIYRLRDAVQRELAVDPRHSRLVLSISGSNISLITGLPSICDDFGVMELPDRVAAYKPGWFVAWNDVEDDKMEALAPMYRLVKVGFYPAYDDPERNLLILYRLDPVNSPRRGRNGRRRYFVNPHQRRQTTRATASMSLSR